jgi:Ice-binding-like/Bacterial Ig-like domain
MRQSKVFPFILAVALTGGCERGNPMGAGGSTSTESSTGAGGSTGTGGSTGAGGSIDTGGSTGIGGSTTQAPTVTSTTPLDGATGVHFNANVSAVFSEAMAPATITASTFTLTSGAVAVPGTVTYASGTAVFWPAAELASSDTFTATITTGAQSAGGIGLAASHVWSFTTASMVTPGIPVDLGAAGGYVILAKSAVSTVAPSAIVGDVGLSPAAATYLTGFSLTLAAVKTFSTSKQVTGNLYAADYVPPTPSALTTAVADMQLAYTAAAGRAPDVTELGAGNIGGKTLAPGVYKWGTGLLIPTDITLTGGATDVWIFQIAQNLTVSNATQVVLAGGALPQNVFWQVAGLASIGTTAHFEGVILTKTAITLNTGASINGRLMAQTAVTLASSSVVEPAP